MDMKQDNNPEERVKAKLRVLAAPDQKEAVDEGPCCVYGLVTRGSLDHLSQQVAELKGRVNTLLWGAGGAVLLDILARMAGK